MNNDLSARALVTALQASATTAFPGFGENPRYPVALLLAGLRLLDRDRSWLLFLLGAGVRRLID